MVCLKCYFSGYLLTENGECEIIDDCIVSNGIDSCIICEEEFILN